MNKKYIMTIDEGTTSVRTLIIDKNTNVVSTSQKEFEQIFPKSGWVEHDAMEIWSAQKFTIQNAKQKAGIKSTDIDSVGITNQRETVVLWDKTNGVPVYNAIVWQDSRTKDFCNHLIEKGYSEKFREKTGLVINPYFSGTKIRWILKNVEKAKKVHEKGNLIAGTIDTWLIWNLTNGKVHATDYSNASRTLLFNIKEGKWDDELLEILDIPKEILPEVKPSSCKYGDINPEVFSMNAKGIVPITGVIGDQQSSLFGHLATNYGDVKNTYGTGCFALLNTGNEIVKSKNNLLTTIAWKINDEEIVYALEGSVFVAGAAIQWLRDNLKIISHASDSTELAKKVQDDQKIYFVPALVGLGAPYWDTSSRGAIIGIERGTKIEHIAKATLDAIAYQSYDLISTMEADLNSKIEKIKVDGGATNSDYLMQFQSSILGKEIIKPENIETTAMGAAYMAGLATKFWNSIEDIKDKIKIDKIYEPKFSNEEIIEKIDGWKDAVKRTRNWIK